MLRHTFYAVLSLGGFLVASTVAARCPVRASSIKTSVLLGSLLDGTSGERIRYGQAVLESRALVMTDTLGHFVVRDVPFGRQALLVRGLGYKSQRVEVDVDADTVRLAAVRLARSQSLAPANIIAP